MAGALCCRAHQRHIKARAKEIAICPYPSLRSLRKNASCDRGMCRLALSVHSHLASARRLETLLLSSPFVLRLKSRSKNRTKKKNDRTATNTWEDKCLVKSNKHKTDTVGSSRAVAESSRRERCLISTEVGPQINGKNEAR